MIIFYHEFQRRIRQHLTTLKFYILYTQTQIQNKELTTGVYRSTDLVPLEVIDFEFEHLH